MNDTETTNALKFSGTGKYKREDSILFMNLNVTSANADGIVFDTENPTWTPIGEDNDEIVREHNHEIESKKNVLGKTTINATPGAETTEIDPIAIRGNDTLSYILYIIHKYGLVGDKAAIPCMEVSLFDAQATTGTYGAFTETAIVDEKSFGGSTAEIDAPITLNWKGDKVHGTYNLSQNKFTKTTSA